MKQELVQYLKRAVRHASRRALHVVVLIAVLLPSAAAAQSLPPGWTVADVGAPAIPGYATYSNQTYTVSGAGTGIGGRADQFTFAYRELTGDGTIVARVATLPNSPRDAKVGVMIRQTLGGESATASLLVSPFDGIMFKRRFEPGGATTNTRTGSGTAPIWLKLDRVSSTITASRSSNGSTWTIVGTAQVSMANVVYIGLAATSFSEVAATETTFTNVQVTSLAESGGPLPAGWSSQDIGSPGRPGGATYEAGTFGLTGGGADVAGTWDQFHFAYTQVDGDVDIVARVSDIGATDALSKAGVMIRDSLTPNGAHASMFVTSSRGTVFRRRPSAGGSTVNTPGTNRRPPVWLKLSVRDGVVTGSQSNDGVSWMVLGTQALTLPSPFYIGLAVTSRDDTATVVANVDNVDVDTSSLPPNDSPSVALTSPTDGATYTAPATITLSATASDTDGSITRVDFYRGGVLIGSDTTSPYGVTWNSAPSGSYSLTATAIDNDGATTTSAAVSVTVNGANQPPSVSLTAPANGAVYTAPATITISANASDTDGTVARVDFYNGAALIGSDTTSPYSMAWSNVGAGTYSLRAVATDDDGAPTNSATRSITVNTAPPPTQRTAVFTASPEHNTLVTSYLLEIFAAGANPSTASPIATQNLGKPPVVNGECSADVTATINALAPGNYQATVAAVGSSGTARSAPVAFTR